MTQPPSDFSLNGHQVTGAIYRELSPLQSEHQLFSDETGGFELWERDSCSYLFWRSPQGAYFNLISGVIDTEVVSKPIKSAERLVGDVMMLRHGPRSLQPPPPR